MVSSVLPDATMEVVAGCFDVAAVEPVYLSQGSAMERAAGIKILMLSLTSNNANFRLASQNRSSMKVPGGARRLHVWRVF